MEGDFSFIEDMFQRKALEWDYEVTRKHNLWEYFRKYEDEFLYVFHTSRYIWWPCHNICSKNVSLKTMEYIAKYGWDHYYIMRN